MARLKKRKLLLPLAAILITSSVVFAFSYPSFVGTITVREPIALTNPSIAINAYPNQKIPLNITVVNSGVRDVTLLVNASVTAFPTGGSKTDIKFNINNPYPIFPQTNVITFTAVVDNGAVAGPYTITITVCRPSSGVQHC